MSGFVHKFPFSDILTPVFRRRCIGLIQINNIFRDERQFCSFGYAFAQAFALEEDIKMNSSTKDSFGFLPWVTVLLTALVVLIACLIATR
jgi:hypothetical protein